MAPQRSRCVSQPGMLRHGAHWGSVAWQGARGPSFVPSPTNGLGSEDTDRWRCTGSQPRPAITTVHCVLLLVAGDQTPSHIPTTARCPGKERLRAAAHLQGSPRARCQGQGGGTTSRYGVLAVGTKHEVQATLLYHSHVPPPGRPCPCCPPPRSIPAAGPHGFVCGFCNPSWLLDAVALSETPFSGFAALVGI